jgi:hypothetical protein
MYSCSSRMENAIFYSLPKRTILLRQMCWFFTLKCLHVQTEFGKVKKKSKLTFSEFILIWPLLNNNKTQTMYLERNTETRSRNQCCSGKAISITYYKCVCSLSFTNSRAVLQEEFSRPVSFESSVRQRGLSVLEASRPHVKFIEVE